jgi:nitrate/nitrite transporter NarK
VVPVTAVVFVVVVVVVVVVELEVAVVGLVVAAVVVVVLVLVVVEVNAGVVAFFASMRHPLRNKQSDKRVAPMKYKPRFDDFVILYLLLSLIIKRRSREKITIIKITSALTIS